MVFWPSPEGHEQDGEKLSRVPVGSGMQQRLAILPWRSEPCLVARGEPFRLLLVAGSAIAAGSNQRMRFRIRSRNARGL